MEGKKTYIALAIAVLGMMGVTQEVIDQDGLTQIVDGVLQLIGLLGAVYGRYDASRRHKLEIESMQED